ncbi:hypothetical protein POM88_027712 [Heracleum sosnowskyi]|uniref:Transposase-associated domain-containing protein n=1 Tax=Heracleum sosnowskyi TaxID=360622 RepID=A0AAD8IAQ7_9APIA|nr:hypothetical protein POM88_027712 [Heracleum sosnowskyi]
MASDRSWIGRNRYNEAKYLTDEYKIGVDNFIHFAIDHLREEDSGLMRCPCRNCGNGTYKKPSTVKLDLYRHGIMQWYTIWDCHGEKDEPHNEVGTSSVNTNYRDDDDDAIDRILSDDEHEIVAYYVLINSPEVGKYLRGFQKDWFERRVQNDDELKKKFLDLIRGPIFKLSLGLPTKKVLETIMED